MPTNAKIAPSNIRAALWFVFDRLKAKVKVKSVHTKPKELIKATSINNMHKSYVSQLDKLHCT